ncbi:hypothetical protein BpHYR1_026961 [Brachionus plicatilis]|uniref:Uncharacterized protein n=1 Tax=Brachionus plicatilis TaxID=10195 RepID=A0A3M7P7B2_BRAPC|nr:hypothetical protein BpHYR1_026961 [Brachionus plicatilis]
MNEFYKSNLGLMVKLILCVKVYQILYKMVGIFWIILDTIRPLFVLIRQFQNDSNLHACKKKNYH